MVYCYAHAAEDLDPLGDGVDKFQLLIADREGSPEPSTPNRRDRSVDALSLPVRDLFLCRMSK
jgi:hypothetical protein